MAPTDDEQTEQDFEVACRFIYEMNTDDQIMEDRTGGPLILHVKK